MNTEMDIAKATQYSTVLRKISTSSLLSSSVAAVAATTTSMMKMEMETETNQNCAEQRVKQSKRVK